MSALEDTKVIQQMKQKIETVNEILDLNDQFSPSRDSTYTRLAGIVKMTRLRLESK